MKLTNYKFKCPSKDSYSATLTLDSLNYSIKIIEAYWIPTNRVKSPNVRKRSMGTACVKIYHSQSERMKCAKHLQPQKGKAFVATSNVIKRVTPGIPNKRAMGANDLERKIRL